LDIGGLSWFSVYNTNVANTLHGIVGRVVYHDNKPPIKPARDAYRKMGRVGVRVRNYIGDCHPLTREAFVNTYPDPRRRRIYEEASNSTLSHPVTLIDSFVRAFVKVEKTNFTNKPNPAPRIIQPRSPRFNIEIGVFLKPLEKRVFKAINKLYGEPTVAKGLNARDRGRLIARKFNSKPNCVAVGLDASRFDLHVSVDALKYCHNISEWCYQKLDSSQRSTLARLLNMQLSTRGVAYCRDGKITYRVEGGRCSGDMDTSSGNVLIMCSLVYCYLTEKALDKDVSLVNDGDDCILFMSERCLPLISDIGAWFVEMGFALKLEEPVREIELIEFCQCRPVRTVGGYVMVRDVRSALIKDLLTWKPVGSHKYWDRYRLTVAKCGMALTSEVPVMRQFYEMLGRGAKGNPLQLDDSGFYRMSIGMRVSEHQFPDDSEAMVRASFYKAFDYTPEEQRALETFFCQVNPTWQGSPSPLKFEQNRINYQI
jgi:hypothetical protein